MIPLAAYFSKMWGTRPFFMAATGVFIAASILTGLSTTFEMMIVTRALQGLGAAQEAKGDLKAAAASFKELTALPTKQGRDYGYFNAGRVLLAQGDKDGAKAALEKLTKEKDFEGSPLRARAEDLLATVQ